MPAAPPAPGELIESGPPHLQWGERWAALPPSGRRLLAGLLVLVLVGAGAAWYHDRAVERELAQRVALTTSLGVSSSSTTPPGGEVGFFVLVRNDGARPVSVTAVEGATLRFRLRMRYDTERRLDPGTENAIPLSIRLSCVPGDGGPSGDADLPVEIRLRREDGGSAIRRIDLQPAALVRDVAETLCSVRPGLRDHELAGPVLRPRTGPVPGAATDGD